jgi:hypothetical protein
MEEQLIRIDVWEDITEEHNPTDSIIVWHKDYVEVYNVRYHDGCTKIPIYHSPFGPWSKGMVKKTKMDMMLGIISDWNELDLEDMTADQVQNKIYQHEWFHFSNKKKTRHGFYVQKIGWDLC